MKFQAYISDAQGQVISERVVELTSEEMTTIAAAIPSEEESGELLRHFKAMNPEKQIEILSIDVFPIDD